MTNYHVIDKAAEIWAVSDNGKDYYPITRVLAANEKKDIAILEFYTYDDAPVLEPLKLFPGGKLRRGEPVVVIGSPQFITNEVTKGDISALYDDDGVPIIQFTAPVSHGSSGGPLFNDSGEVIGITRSTITDNQNTNQAIDISEVIQLFKTREGAGIIRFPWEDLSGHTSAAALRPAAKPTPTTTAMSAPTLAPSMVPSATPRTPMTPPSNVKGSAGIDGITITWDAVPYANIYQVYRSFNSGEFVLVEQTLSTRYLDKGAIEPGVYSYKIKSSDGASLSKDTADIHEVSSYYNIPESLPAPSLVPSATPRPPLTPPVSVKGSAGIEGITITWDAVPYANIYQVYRSVNSGEFVLLEQTLSTRYLDKGAIEPGVYSYKIKSSDGASLSKDTADIHEVSSYYKISESLPAPSNFKAKAGGTAVTLTWSKVKNAKEYAIYRSTTSTGTYIELATVTASKYTDKDVKRGYTYYYKIRSMYGANVSETSEAVKAEMPKPTPTPKPKRH